MTREVFAFLPFIILLLTIAAVLALIIGGVIGLSRGQGGLTKAVSIAAIVTGVLTLLALGVSVFVGLEPLVFLPILFALLGLFSLVVWVATLADCAVNEPSQGNDKLVWVIIIVFTHIVGAILYLVVRRPLRISETGR